MGRNKMTDSPDREEAKVTTKIRADYEKIILAWTKEKNENTTELANQLVLFLKDLLVAYTIQQDFDIEFEEAEYNINHFFEIYNDKYCGIPHSYCTFYQKQCMGKLCSITPSPEKCKYLYEELNSNEHFFSCDCKGEGLLLTKDDEGENIYFALYGYGVGYRPKPSLWERIKYAWYHIKTGKKYADCLVMDYNKALEVSKWLHSNAL